MPADFSVKQVVGFDDWDSEHGYFRAFEMVLEGPGAPNSTVKMNRKKVQGEVPADKIPSEGTVLYGTIQGDKFKTAQREGAPASSNGSGAKGGDDFARRPEHPQNAARMARSKALELAPRYYELFRTENALASAGGDLQATKAKLVQISEWLEGLIDAAYEEPKPEPEVVTGPAPVSADDQVPF